MRNIFAFLGLGLSLFATELSWSQTWTPVQNVPSGIGATNPLLLTDGSVLIQNFETNNWYKLTPDNKGNYSTGTWTQLASDPSDWQPYAYGSEVMPDGRVFAMGGEYNLGLPVWTGLGGIYDPVKNAWTPISAPSAWSIVGDMATVVLPNGLVYMADPGSSETAAFNPATNQIIYPYGGNALMYNDEAGMILLPNGNVYRTDCWQASTAEEFNTQTLQWSFLPQMPYNVADLNGLFEMGPAIVSIQRNGLSVRQQRPKHHLRPLDQHVDSSAELPKQLKRSDRCG